MAISPDIILYPQLNTEIVSYCLALTRLAPLQLMFYGYPDYFVNSSIDFGLIIEGHVGINHSPKNWPREKIIELPREIFSWHSTTHNIGVINKPSTLNTFHIGITATAQKINLPFLEMCQEIAEKSMLLLEFHFFTSTTHCYYLKVQQDILKRLPKANIYWRLNMVEYIDKLAECDLLLSPFPYGNSSGVIDAINLGIPSLALICNNIAGRSDYVILRECLLDVDLCCFSTEEYKKKALSLIHSSDLMHDLRQKIIKAKSILEERNKTETSNQDNIHTFIQSIYNHRDDLLAMDKPILSVQDLSKWN
jgi:hypothetical protein